MISFNQLLEAAGLDLREVRFLRHQDTRATFGRTPYKIWQLGPELFDQYQGIQSTHNADRLKVPYWASFVGTPSGATLFVGMYAAKYAGLNSSLRISPHDDTRHPPGTIHTFELIQMDTFSEYIGRLGIEWGRGTRSWIQRPDKQLKQIVFIRESANPPSFPGFQNLIIRLSEVASLPESWENALRNTRGVYLLTCPHTKEQYVGAASGERGFLGRWHDYAATGTGGNVGLKSRNPSDYQIAILETVGSGATTEDILRLETLWKQKLQSREMGLNRN